MSFLWGKKDEFEKSGNTIRGAYNFKPSYGYFSRKKFFEQPVINITNEYFEEIMSGFNGEALYESNVTYSDFDEYFFGNKYYEDTLEVAFGGVIYGSSVSYNSYEEYRFFNLPFSGGYTDNMDNITGGMIYKLEVTHEG